jgi:protein-disulfide isomerase
MIMHTRTQRGRASQSAPRSLRPFYIALALIAIAGVVVIATTMQRNRTVAMTGTLDGYQTKGSANAPVTVVEYADFQCPGCAYFATQLEPGITRDYVDTGKIRFVYHEFPLNIHPNAIPAAEAGRCAADQGAFWPMHNLLFAKQDEWAEQPQPNALFAAYAEQLKLDRNAFTQCLASGKHRAEVLAARQQAEAAQIPSTPSFVINGKRYEALELRGAIDAALAAKQ